jgi:hypothetical protein
MLLCGRPADVDNLIVPRVRDPRNAESVHREVPHGETDAALDVEHRVPEDDLGHLEPTRAHPDGRTSLDATVYAFEDDDVYFLMLSLSLTVDRVELARAHLVHNYHVHEVSRLVRDD